MNTLIATIKFDQTPEVGDDLCVKVYRRERLANNEGNVSPAWYALSFFANDNLMQCLDSFVSYEAAVNAAFQWLNSPFEGE